MLGNIRAQPVGPHTVGDYDLPETLLRRLADRIIRASFIERHRRVLGEVPEVRTDGDGAAPPAESGIRVARTPVPVEVSTYRDALAEERPPLPGYRAPVLAGGGDLWPAAFPDGGDGPLRAAADHVATRLSRDGLISTLLGCISILGPDRVLAEGTDVLRRAGLPTDLLEHFVTDDGDRGAAIHKRLAHALAHGDRAAAAEAAAAAHFNFRAAVPGFCLPVPAGPISLLRLHLTGANYWGGQGAGGSLDVARQLVANLPAARVIATAEDQHLPAFLIALSTWGASDRLTLLPIPHPVSQWAQDNAALGVIDGGSEPLALLPRFASRGEDGSIHIPGETFAGEALVAAGLRVAQSPLLFQGGNVLAAASPDGSASLLIGEAEVARNVLLGLSREQALEALRREFGAERALVLPAVSFHIDFDVLPWHTPTGTIVFVNEPLLAAREVLRAGLAPLQAAGVLSAAESRRVGDLLRSGRVGPAAAALATPVFRTYQGGFPIPLGRAFSTGPTDNGPSNLQRFVLALDLIMAEAVDPVRLGAQDHAAAYLRSFRRTAADRRGLHQMLAREGFEVAPIPGISEASHGISYLNGLRDGGRYLMPAYAGLYANLDDLAAEALLKRLPTGSEVVRIQCAETQRRSGGLHCAAGAFSHSA